MRVGSSVNSDNSHSLRHTDHTHRALFSDAPCVATTWPLYTCTVSPQAIPSGRVGPIAPGQDPYFDKQQADTHRGMWWPHSALILVAGQCVCVIGVSKL